MATPTKISAITFENAQLTDPDLAVANIDKAQLIQWLNSNIQPNVAVYFESDGQPGQEQMRMVMAPASSGGISSSNHFQSAPLPCPPYCKPR